VKDFFVFKRYGAVTAFVSPPFFETPSRKLEGVFVFGCYGKYSYL
jgi:hypothetical protein